MKKLLISLLLAPLCLHAFPNMKMYDHDEHERGYFQKNYFIMRRTKFENHQLLYNIDTETGYTVTIFLGDDMIDSKCLIQKSGIKELSSFTEEFPHDHDIGGYFYAYHFKEGSLLLMDKNTVGIFFTEKNDSNKKDI